MQADPAINHMSPDERAALVRALAAAALASALRAPALPSRGQAA